MGQIFLDFRLVLVLCGSVSTWIRDHIVDDGSFYGRRSLDIVVPELRQPTFTGRTLRLLVNGPRSAAEITEAIGMERGGRVSDALEQLVESGLVSADEGNNTATGAAARETLAPIVEADGYFDAIVPFRRLLGL